MESPTGHFASTPEGVSGMAGRAVRRDRIQSFDLARGFTVLWMPSIHVVMLFSLPVVQQSLLGDLLGGIAEGPGAQLFMFLMGVSFTLSTKISRRQVLRRSGQLLVAAYLLNVLKFLIPLGLGLLPENLTAELHLDRNGQAAIFFLLIGDILQFAAIAYLVLYIVSSLRHSPWWALGIAIIITFTAPLLWDLQTGFKPLDYVISLFNGHPPNVFFPVLPWLVYPLLGLFLGYLLRYHHINYLMKKAGVAGIGLIVFAISFPPTVVTEDWLPFYRTRPADTLFHIGFVLCWLSMFHWISRKIRPNGFFRLLSFCSRHITTIYFIQWILICWCLGVTGYLQLNLPTTLLWMLGVTVTTLLITWRIKKNHAA